MVTLEFGCVLRPFHGTILCGPIIALLFVPVYRRLLPRLNLRAQPAALHGADAAGAGPDRAGAAAPGRWHAAGVARLARESGDQVSAQLKACLPLVDFLSPGSGLRAGRRVALVVDASAVVIALAD